MSSDTKTKQNTGIKIKESFKIKVKEPARYRVILLNNNYTWPQAVVDVLRAVFNKDQQIAMQIMQFAHNNGRGLVEAPVTKDIGDAKIVQAAEYCKKRDLEMNYDGISLNYSHLKFELEEDK